MRLPVLYLALAALPLWSCSKKPAGGPPKGGGGPVPVIAGQVIKKDMPVDIRAIGNVESIATVGIKAQVGGELIGVHFNEGQDVKKGDLLFTIQPKLYATQLAQAEANLARDRASAASARREANRQEELDRKGAASKEQLDQSRAQADAAEATVKADEALAEIARVRLGYSTIESPIDGRTGALRVQQGNLIKENADDAMVTIRQIAPIYVSFAVPEQYLARIRASMAEGDLSVTAVDPKSAQALGKGELTFIDNVVDTTTGTVILKATFANDDRALWPGAFVDVLLRLKVEKDMTVAPASSVTVGQRGPQIFVIKPDNTADLRQVVVERTVGDESVIKQGVQPGEKIVITGQSRLVPGSPVVIKPAGPENAAKPDGKKEETAEADRSGKSTGTAAPHNPGA